MINIVFYPTLLVASALLALSLLALWWERFQFWPPPNKKSWQYHTFWTLFRLQFGGILLLAILDFQPVAPSEFWWRYLLGGALTALGFGAAFAATHHLGWDNAHGEDVGLQTTGWYRWSRNPVYVVSFVGIIGLGLLINSAHLWLILVLWILLYVVAPFLEERWLTNQYGAAYVAYKEKVPRFFSF